MSAEIRTEREQVEEAIPYPGSWAAGRCKLRGRPPAWICAHSQPFLNPARRNPELRYVHCLIRRQSNSER
jgi:hypothetical protein